MFILSFNAIKRTVYENEEYWPLSDRKVFYLLLNIEGLLRNDVRKTPFVNDEKCYNDVTDMITADMLPPEILSERLQNDSRLSVLMAVPLREARESFEREYLKVQIRRFSGNISKTAGFIGMERSALHRKLKLLGMADRRDEDHDAVDE